MAAKHEERLILPANIAQISALLSHSDFTTSLHLQPCMQAPFPNGITYQFSHSVSFTSWGEDIVVRLTAIHDAATEVILHSECSLPTQIIDWGKNKENVALIKLYLENHLPMNQL